MPGDEAGFDGLFAGRQLLKSQPADERECMMPHCFETRSSRKILVTFFVNRIFEYSGLYRRIF